MKTETFQNVPGATEGGEFSAPAFCFKSLAAKDLPSLVSFYLQLDFDARRRRFGGTVSDHSLRQYCAMLNLDRSVVLGCFDPAGLVAAIELHPLIENWEAAELAVAGRHARHTTNIISHLLQLAAFVVGERGCNTLIVPFHSRQFCLIELLRGMGRVRVHDDSARLDVSDYACLRDVSTRLNRPAPRSPCLIVPFDGLRTHS